MGQSTEAKRDGKDAPVLNKKQVRAYIVDIEKKIIDREGADMASLVAINQLLNMPNADKVLDDELRRQLKDLWIKLKANGIQVEDPPLLFGLPEGFGEEETEEEEELAVSMPEQPERLKKAPSSKQEDTSLPDSVKDDIAISEKDQELPH